MSVHSQALLTPGSLFLVLLCNALAELVIFLRLAKIPLLRLGVGRQCSEVLGAQGTRKCVVVVHSEGTITCRSSDRVEREWRLPHNEVFNSSACEFVFILSYT